MNGIAPSYLQHLIRKHVPRRNLRSVDGHLLVDVGYKLSRYLGDVYAVDVCANVYKPNILTDVVSKVMAVVGSVIKLCRVAYVQSDE